MNICLWWVGFLNWKFIKERRQRGRGRRRIRERGRLSSDQWIQSWVACKKLPSPAVRPRERFLVYEWCVCKMFCFSLSLSLWKCKLNGDACVRLIWSQVAIGEESTKDAESSKHICVGGMSMVAWPRSNSKQEIYSSWSKKVGDLKYSGTLSSCLDMIL